MNLEFTVLLSICTFIILWALPVPRRILSCPFLVAGACLFFVLPQLYVVINNPDVAPDHGVSVFSIYASICVLSCFVGYSIEPRSTPQQRRKELSQSRLFILATAVAGAGVTGFVALNLYLQTHRVIGMWSGIPVYLYTLSKLVIPGLFLFRLLFLFYDQRKYLLASLVLSIPMIIQAFAIGRRQWIFLLLYAWFFPTILAGRLKIRWGYGVAGIIFAFFMIVLVPAYRGSIRSQGYAKIPDIISKQPPAEVLEHYFSGDQTLEIRDTCILMDRIDRNKKFSFGARFCNGFVKQYVPGSLVGRDLKKSLYLPVFELEKATEVDFDQIYRGGEIKFYTSKTGFYDSFAEFWWGGAILYLILGVVFRRIEDRCFIERDPVAILILAFIGFMPAALVYGRWNFIVMVFLPAFVILFAAVNFATVRRPDVSHQSLLTGNSGVEVNG